MKIIARKGSSFLIEVKKDVYWKYDADYNETFKNVYLQGQLSHSPGWINTDGGALKKDIIAKAKEAKEIILEPIEKNVH